MAPTDPAADAALHQSIAGFMTDFTNFSNGLTAKLQQQDDRMNKLDRKTIAHTRSAMATTPNPAAPHQAALPANLRALLAPYHNLRLSSGGAVQP